MNPDKKQIRWKQRFENYKRAFELLERAISIEDPSETEKGGIIQFYEMTFELAWKTLKDYNEALGFITKSPRETIKQSFQIDFIKNGHLWMDALDDRNLTAHIYDEKISNQIILKIRDSYFEMLKQLYLDLKIEEEK